MSLAISEAVQKNGGNSHHPIWKIYGTTIVILFMLHSLPFLLGRM